MTEPINPMLKPGETIKAGTLVLLTSGSYSSYSITGLFRAPSDIVVPAATPRYPGQRLDLEEEADIERLSTLLEEVTYVEVWRD